MQVVRREERHVLGRLCVGSVQWSDTLVNLLGWLGSLLWHPCAHGLRAGSNLSLHSSAFGPLVAAGRAEPIGCT